MSGIRFYWVFCRFLSVNPFRLNWRPDTLNCLHPGRKSDQLNRIGTAPAILWAVLLMARNDTECFKVSEKAAQMPARAVHLCCQLLLRQPAQAAVIERILCDGSQQQMVGASAGVAKIDLLDVCQCFKTHRSTLLIYACVIIPPNVHNRRCFTR